MCEAEDDRTYSATTRLNVLCLFTHETTVKILPLHHADLSMIGETMQMYVYNFALSNI